MILRYLVFFLFLNTQVCVVAQTTSLQVSELIEAKIPNPPTLADKQLGTALALSGTTAAITAHSDDLGTGSVYIYDVKESWQVSAELTSQQASDDFARRIILEGDRLIVSADRDDSLSNDSGAVYVYERNDPTASPLWKQVTKITAPDGQAGDRFGQGIAMIENTLYIGAPFRQQGKVYIYSQDASSKEWVFQKDIEPNDPQALRFGAAIAQEQNTLIIGAPYTDADNSGNPDSRASSAHSVKGSNISLWFSISKGDTFDPGLQSGAVFVYELVKGVWQQTTRIGASNRETGDHLGERIAINGNTIVASLKQKDVWDELRAGSVYTYKRVANGWQEDTALTADVPQFGGSFGTSFSVLDSHILVGANKTHSNGFNSGKVYLFNQKPDESWQIIHQQTNAAVTAHDQFGLSTALGEDKMLVASKNAVYSFQNSAMAYYPAIYYLDHQLLQLDEVGVSGGGVYRATLKLSQQADKILLTLTNHQLLKNKNASDISYSTDSGQLTIPLLAVQQGVKDYQIYSATLKRVEGADTLQFQVTSLDLAK